MTHDSKRRSGVLALLATAALACASACTLLTGGDAVQCATDGDCSGRGFAGYTCGSAGVCVAPPAGNLPIVTPQNDQPQGCATDDDCIAANGGRAAMCPTPGGQCQKLTNAYCQVSDDYLSLTPALRRNAIFIGNLRTDTSSSGNNSTVSRTFGRWIELAHSEAIATLTSGGLSGGPNGGRRPVVLVTCEAGDLAPDVMSAIAQHLLVVVKTPVVFGYVTRPPADFWAASVAINQPVLLMTSSLGNMRAVLRGTGDLSTLFNTMGGLDLSGTATATRMNTLEAEIKAMPGFDGPDLRVAQLTATTAAVPELQSLGGAYTDRLFFNGNSAATQQGTNYQVIQYETTSGPRYVEAAAEVVAMKPHAIALAGDLEIQRIMIPLIESQWPGGHLPPVYGGTPIQGHQTMLDLIGANDGLRQRFSGALPAGDTPEPSRLAVKMGSYSVAFPGIPLAPPQPYDAFYQVLYAIVAAGDVPGGHPSPADVLRGLQKLGQGTSFHTGSDDLQAAMNQLVNQGSITLLGTYGLPLSFDQATGEHPMPVAQIFCETRLANGTVGTSYQVGVSTGQVYDVATQQMKGTYVCP